MSDHTQSALAIPDGFRPIRSGSPFDERFGGVYCKEDGNRFLLGFRVQPHHLNDGGTLHGGAMATLADWQLEGVRPQLGISAEVITPTISLSVEYLAPSTVGTWLECRAELQKRTGRMAFTRAELYADEILVARSSAIYHLPRTICGN